MSDIDGLGSRISVALDRIRQGLDTLERPSLDEDGAATNVEMKLLEEQNANAQLEERVRSLKAMQDTKLDGLEDRVAAQREQLVVLDKELQRLRQSNADMREINAQLRSAVSESVSSPELLNRAMMAEIEALNAQRAAEAAEVSAIITELKPLIEEPS